MKTKDTILKDIKGNSLKDGDRKDMGLFDTIANILLTTKSDKPELSYKIAFRIIKGGEQELTSEEITYIKDTVRNNEQWLPIVTGQIIDLLDPVEEKKK